MCASQALHGLPTSGARSDAQFGSALSRESQER